MIRWFFNQLRNSFSTEVSPEVAACEFDCREQECLDEDFLVCPKRLQKADAIHKLSEKDWPLHYKDLELINIK